jgi:hypothetical protein
MATTLVSALLYAEDLAHYRAQLWPVRSLNEYMLSIETPTSEWTPFTLFMTARELGPVLFPAPTDTLDT